jgi:hypothetical protein
VEVKAKIIAGDAFSKKVKGLMPANALAECSNDLSGKVPLFSAVSDAKRPPPLLFYFYIV